MLLNITLQHYLIKQILKRCRGIRCITLIIVNGCCIPNSPARHTKILAAAPPPMEMSSQASGQSTLATGINNRGDVALCMQKLALTLIEVMSAYRFNLTISGM